MDNTEKEVVRSIIVGAFLVMGASFVLAAVLCSFLVVYGMQYINLSLSEMDKITFGIPVFFMGIFFFIVMRASIRTWKEHRRKSGPTENTVGKGLRIVAMVCPFFSVFGAAFGIWFGWNIFQDVEYFWHEDAQKVCEKAKTDAEPPCFERAMECLRIVHRKGIGSTHPRRESELSDCMEH